MATTSSLSVVDMLQAGIHFGHKPSKRHPKMSPYIFGIKNGISVLDLERTKEQLEKILPMVEALAAAGKSILFLGTKPQAKAVIKAAAEQAGMPFIVERWLGGLLTNYGHVGLSMKKLTQLKEEKEQGVWTVRYTKKEQLMLEREIESLEELVGGIESMTKLPDAMFVVDCKKEKTAIKEANRLHIPVIAMVDTNVNPDKIDYPIPANDDGIKSITYITNQIVAAIERGRAQALQATPVSPAAAATPVA